MSNRAPGAYYWAKLHDDRGRAQAQWQVVQIHSTGVVAMLIGGRKALLTDIEWGPEIIPPGFEVTS